MEATEALIMDWYPAMSQAWSLSHPAGLFSGSRVGTIFTKFTPSPQVLYIRRDNGQPELQVNVFDTSGNQVFSIERTSRFSTLWVVYRTNNRSQMALIKCGLFLRTISFADKPEIQTRTIGSPRLRYGGLPDHQFYLTDGAPYEWTRNSQYLERIINPGGGHEETRQRLARVRLLRGGRFEYELLVDPEFDSEIALATSFVSMLTEWSTLHLTVPGARTAATQQ